jgi:D-serine deaminase-like pyridoxal phosphate-dependent protein
MDRDGPELIVCADSVVGVERMAARLHGRRRPLPVLVEVGVAGARTGVRTDEAAVVVARAIDAADGLTLAGASLYEGVVGGETAGAREAAVRDLTDRTRRIVGGLGALFDRAGLSEIIVTGGGSTYPDVVAAELTRAWDTSRPVRVVLRSGAYVTHDHGLYERSSPFGMRAAPGGPRLQPAIEVWAPVMSVPEPGLAFAGAGRRDLPVDQDLPLVIKVRDAETGAVRTAERGVTVTKLADQHAFLALSKGAHVAVGDLVAFGISHPCTAFQLWREAVVVDDADRIVDVYELRF